MLYVGVDLGKRVDPAAVAIVERPEAVQHWMGLGDRRLSLRWLERMPLGMPYTLVARRIVEIAHQLSGKCAVAVDATGLGAPVVDVLRQSAMECELAPVVITGGEQQRRSGDLWHVPKRDLVGGVQILLEQGELRIARNLKDTGALVRELVGMRATPAKRGVRMAAEGSGHDDLVMAVALACWQARRPEIGFGRHLLPGT